MGNAADVAQSFGRVATALFLICVPGCTGPTDFDWGSPPFVESSAGSCEPSDVQPSVCGWALSCDAVIVGKVERVESSKLPIRVTYVGGGGDSQIIDSETEAMACVAQENGLKLVVRVLETLRATDSLPLENDDLVDVHLGGRGLRQWSGRPSEWDEDLTVTAWTGEGEIKPGDVLGLPLHLDVRGAATVVPDATFVEVDGQLEFRDRGTHCVDYEGSPIDQASGSYAQLKSTVAGCSDTGAVEEELTIRANVRTNLYVPFSQGADCMEAVQPVE